MAAKARVEIVYCFHCGYLGTASWIVNELYAEADNEVAVTLPPGTNAILQVFLDGEKIYDKKDENGHLPNLHRVREMRSRLHEKLTAAVPISG